MDVDDDIIYNKRDGPDSRAVTLGPESKKQERLCHLEKAADCMSEVFMNMHRKQWMARPDSLPETLHSDNASATMRSTDGLFYMDTPHAESRAADLRQGCIFKVDSEVYDRGMWDQVTTADAKEIKQFVKEKTSGRCDEPHFPKNV